MTLKVGVVRDDGYFSHRPYEGYADSPERLAAIYQMLDSEFEETLITIAPKLATLEQLELVHSPAYITKVLRTSERTLTPLAADTPAGSDSHFAAWLAAGGCIRGFQALISGKCDVCFALVRPPGRRARPDKAAGRCIFNNLGVTGRYALLMHGYRRILVVDWDASYGDGLQDLFYEDKETLCLSTHRDDNGVQGGAWDDVGAGSGMGYTINIPIPPDVGERDVLYLYWKLLGPIMMRFRPDLILVAAGFSGSSSGGNGKALFSPDYFGNLMGIILDLRVGTRAPPVLLALEDGYDIGALVSCVKSILVALTTRDRRRRSKPTETSILGTQLFEKAASIHSEYGIWVDRR